eukprot:scaffold24669_cov124-Isochrysis_galbana.AAC.2
MDEPPPVPVPTCNYHHSQRLSRAAVMADAKAICKEGSFPKAPGLSSPPYPPPPTPLFRFFSFMRCYS